MSYDQFAAVYDICYADKDYASEAALFMSKAQEASPHASRWLDVACGTGKHLVEFEKSFETVGFDLEPRLLERARGRLTKTELHQGDMTALPYTEEFDVVTCLFSAVGHLQSVGELDASFAGMARALRSGGVLIVEPWIAPDKFHSGLLHAMDSEVDGIRVQRMTYSWKELPWSFLDMNFMVGEAGVGVSSFRDLHRMYLFTQDEYMSAAAKAGLDAVWEEETSLGRGLIVGRKP